MKEANLDSLQEDIACAMHTHVPVLITSRDSKERKWIAHTIHAGSTRALGPFVRVNCAGPRKPLLATDLFGNRSERLAGQDESGALARAQGGTIFLDEVGELSPPVQALFSQFFETGDVQSTLAIDVRVITASSRSLFERVLTREFREDLFYRLNVIHIRVSR